MTRFSIHFDNPWLLFLLIPAIAFTLLPYFRLSKKYRRTRNRIISMVLHLVVMTLLIFVLSGVQIWTHIPVDTNEILLLVDVSDTQNEMQDRRDAFISTVLADAAGNNFQVGIVTFGFDQEYAVPLTKNLDEVFELYSKAELPDTSATDVASALTYAQSVLKNPQTAKIVLVTDGKETDRQASNVISTLAAKGTKVDTVYLSADVAKPDVQIIGVEFSGERIVINEETSISVTVQSNVLGDATIEVWKDDALEKSMQFSLTAGTQTVLVPYTLQMNGLNELEFKLSGIGADKNDTAKNDVYRSYIYLGKNNKILVIDSMGTASENLADLINGEANEAGEYPYEIDVVSNTSTDRLPKTVVDLCNYNQVILNNIANSDMPEGFFEILKEYVEVYGGGLFTVGGSNSDDTQHAYDPADMRGTTYQDILPVQAIEYTPPVAIVFVIDNSGSMTGTPLEAAKTAMISCIKNEDVITVRDYVALLTCDTEDETIVPLTQCINATVRDSISKKVHALASYGGTDYLNAIETAGVQLRLLENVAKKHVVYISDAQVGDTGYSEAIKRYHDSDGITFSFIGIGIREGDDDYIAMQNVFEGLGGGRVIAAESGDEQMIRLLREELNATEIKSYNPMPFNPTIVKTSSVLDGIPRKNLVGEDGTATPTNCADLTVGGFYGTRNKSSAEVILRTDYGSPLYAQWRYGKGMVGSYMSDLTGAAGSWSEELMASEYGAIFVRNIIKNLMPTGDVSKADFNLVISEDNYTNRLSVRGLRLGEGEYLKGEIVDLATDESIPLTKISAADRNTEIYVTSALDKSTGYTRCEFIIKRSGTYKIVVQKCNAKGEVLTSVEMYKTFSYSKEYDAFYRKEEETFDGNEQLTRWAGIGKGSLIKNADNPVEIFKDFVTSFSEMHDPRMAMVITAIVLFLLDVAVRKFKFKWIHEIVREHKQKKDE